MALTKVKPSNVDDRIFGRRNLVINGDMRVAQRGTSQTGISSSGYYSVDRMRHAGSSLATSRHTQEQSTDAPAGFGYSLKHTVTTAEGAVNADDNFYPLNYRIEAQDLKRIGFATSSAQKLTVSFYVKASVAGTYVLGLYLPDSQRAQGRTYAISSANTWEFKSLTFAAGTTASDFVNLDRGTGLDMYFCGGAGSQFTTGTLPQTWSTYSNADFLAGQNVQLQNTVNSTWQITGLQVEAGDTATPFEYLNIGEQLELCRRYYQRYVSGVEGSNYRFGIGCGVNTNGLDTMFHFQPNMAKVPSLDAMTAGNYRTNFNATATQIYIVHATRSGTCVRTIHAANSVEYKGCELLCPSAFSGHDSLDAAYIAFDGEL